MTTRTNKQRHLASLVQCDSFKSDRGTDSNTILSHTRKAMKEINNTVDNSVSIAGVIINTSSSSSAASSCKYQGKADHKVENKSHQYFDIRISSSPDISSLKHHRIITSSLPVYENKNTRDDNDTIEL